jgi:hypothetical protein
MLAREMGMLKPGKVSVDQGHEADGLCLPRQRILFLKSRAALHGNP